MILQLNPMLPVIVTSKGNRKGYAFLVTEHGEDCYKMWSVILDDSGEIWDVPNPEIRVQSNWTLGRRVDTEKQDTHASQCTNTQRVTEIDWTKG